VNTTLTPVAESLDHVRSIVRRQLRGLIDNFAISREQQGLILTGIARSYYAKLIAQEVVMRHVDAPIARNDIEVDRG
jgi:predicted transcriptional regulator